MSAHSAPALDAVAFQIVATLERYDERVDRMVDTWLDMDLYRDVSELVEEIRMYCGALPALVVPWVELLIAHAELVHSLWRLQCKEEGPDRRRLQEVRERHAGCVASLRARCLRLLWAHQPVRG